jgi:HlyD family secretion protein
VAFGPARGGLPRQSAAGAGYIRRRSPLRMKRKTLVVLTLLIGGLGGLIAWQALKPKEPTKVLTAKVERMRELRAIVSATGEIRAKEFVDIQTEVAGVIVEVRVLEGDQVQKGDMLLRLDDRQLRTDEDSTRAMLGAAEADAKNTEVGVATAIAQLRAEETAIANLKVDLEQARTTRDRAASAFARRTELFAQGLIGPEEHEVAAAEARLSQQRLEWSEARVKQGEASLHAMATRVDAAKAVCEAAQRRIESARASLARASDMLRRTVLLAPLSGLVTKLNVEKGERAVPGIQSNPIATLITIADMSVIEAEIQVDEADIVHVQLGAAATVEVDALRDVKIAGSVTEIGQSPIQVTTAGSNQNQEGKDFKVVVRLQDPPASLRPGFTATADIVTATRTDCLVVPMQSLTAREVRVDADAKYLPPPEPVGDEILPVVSASDRHELKELEGVFLLQDGRARFRPFRYGIAGDMDLEVLDGLQAGDEVVLGPYQALRTLKEWDRIAVDEKRQAEDALRLRRKRR